MCTISCQCGIGHDYGKFSRSFSVQCCLLLFEMLKQNKGVEKKSNQMIKVLVKLLHFNLMSSLVFSAWNAHNRRNKSRISMKSAAHFFVQFILLDLSIVHWCFEIYGLIRNLLVCEEDTHTQSTHTAQTKQLKVVRSSKRNVLIINL